MGMVKYLGVSGTLNRYIEDHGVKKSWVADRMGISGSTLSYKLKNDTFTFSEVVRLAYILDSEGKILEYLIDQELEYDKS